MTTLLQLEGVEKQYGALRALKGVNLTLEPGRIGLLGPNGAGKSTLLKSVLGLVRPEHGSLSVLGMDALRQPLEVRAHIGYMPEGDAILPDLTAVEFATLAAELAGLPRAEAVARAHQVLHYVGLGEARYRPLHSYSTGMKQRARLAQALVGDPKLLLLDEPTSGLDPRGREEMLAIIRDIPERTGASVILSTHILHDVETTCERVVVLSGGEIVFSGDLDALTRPEAGLYEVRTHGRDADLAKALRAAGQTVEDVPGALRVRLAEAEAPTNLLKLALDAGIQVRHLAPLERSLEEAFLETVAKAEAQ
ncbi:MAG: ABC transporter ATP-binding protein [Polyangiales bacterium]